MAGHISHITVHHLLHYLLGVTVGVGAPGAHELEGLAEGFATNGTLKLATVDAQPGLAIVTDGEVPH
jgi:hypothetical protein